MLGGGVGPGRNAFPGKALIPGWHQKELQSMIQNLIFSADDWLPQALASQCVLLSNGNWAVPFFSVSRLPPHFSYRASHVSIMNLGVLVPICIPKGILKCLCNARMLTHTEGCQHDSVFLFFVLI